MLSERMKQLLARLLCTTECAGDEKRASLWLAFNITLGLSKRVPLSSSTVSQPVWHLENLPYKNSPKAVVFPVIRWAPQFARSRAFSMVWEAWWFTKMLHLFEHPHGMRKRGSTAATRSPANTLSTSVGVRHMNRLARHRIVVVSSTARPRKECFP